MELLEAGEIYNQLITYKHEALVNSAGGEVEVASNFALHKGLNDCPTVAMKYSF